MSLLAVRLYAFLKLGETRIGKETDSSTEMCVMAPVETLILLDAPASLIESMSSDSTVGSLMWLRSRGKSLSIIARGSQAESLSPAMSRRKRWLEQGELCSDLYAVRSTMDLATLSTSVVGFQAERTLSVSAGDP
jgi:hypothetical protein